MSPAFAGARHISFGDYFCPFNMVTIAALYSALSRKQVIIDVGGLLSLNLRGRSLGGVFLLGPRDK